MPLLFLNEKSCGTGCDPDHADRAMTRLARAVLAVLRADRAGTVLVGKEAITALQIADGHPIAKWGGQARNRDYWKRLLQMQSKWPHRAVFPEGEGHYDVEYRHRGEVVDGLGAAHLMDGLGVSLPVDPCWEADHLTLEREQLVEDENDAPGSETSEVHVRHLSDPEHCETHGAWIRECVETARKGGLEAVRQGGELWERRAELFPRLEFLPRVEGDLRELPQAWVQPVCRRLAELDEAVSAWDPASEPDGPQWHSWVTGEHQQRSLLCWFTDLDGERRLFDTHSRFTPGVGRVHFRLVAEKRTVRVAYLGRKLGL